MKEKAGGYMIALPYNNSDSDGATVVVVQLNIAEVFQDKKIKVPKRGVLSEPLLETEGGTHSINYKLMVDRDPIHNTFRPIIKGELGPAFDSSISIVKCVEAGASTKTTPAVRYIF